MQNVDKIENLIIEYFNYINKLRKKIGALNNKIKSDSELLDTEKRIENQYIEMLKSDCLGKGDYHDLIMLPNNIKTEVDTNSKLSEEEKKDLLKKYKVSLENAKKLEEFYNRLQSDEPNRIKRIKKYKSNLRKYKTEVKRHKKDYKCNMIKIKKLDNKINTKTKN